jgi:hypothetical protein
MFRRYDLRKTSQQFSTNSNANVKLAAWVGEKKDKRKKKNFQAHKVKYQRKQTQYGAVTDF